MKKALGILILFLGLSNLASAQRYAYVDTQFILDNIPEYAEAQTELDRLTELWLKEVEDRFNLVDQKRREFEAEKILLPEEIKNQRLKEINKLEAEAKQLQKQRFGVGGDLFMKREELIKPIQDQIYTAIQTIAEERNFAFVFDKANQSNLLFADPKYDISRQVLIKMGIKVDNRN
ncbi:OmpH family outer membrane protein [Paracrocinitomix mangrovi]|uniref:OmpH family outer membrane protein n=1 Tax=Paracrocinitomix mangrovi TaxID=2862509 RepID=UPI001C8F1BBF|nr:OmpH family outer membrane protein [Paracrocinitomix mangrovi]UKN03584.1 OmpH family outer membrane protein [Paracrocinitomix mangrovi]